MEVDGSKNKMTESSVGDPGNRTIISITEGSPGREQPKTEEFGVSVVLNVTGEQFCRLDDDL